jgi:hypothetical protein
MTMNNKMKRTGVALSLVWILVGGYFIYLQNSNQDYWRTIRSICSMGSAKDCANMTARSEGMFATDWTSITGYVALGVFAIWVALFIIAWIQKGNSEG